MKVYNLTDKQPPTLRKRRPKAVRLGGQVIPPGESAEVPDHVRRSTFAGLVRRGVVSVDGLPPWYQTARRAETDKKVEPKAPEQEETEGIEPVKSVEAVDIDLMELDDPKPKKGKKKGKK